MMRIWKLLCLTAFFVTLFSAAPSLAQEQTPKNTDKPDKTEQQLKAMGEQIAALNKKMTDGFDALRSDLKNFRTDYDVGMQAARRDITDLNAEILRLKSDLESLRKTTTNMTRQSGFAPGSTTAPAATGWVELLNTWSAPVTVKVNNRTYRLRPGDRVLTDPLPAGSFNYEVFSITAPNNVRTLAANEVYLIHIHPQP